MNRKLCTFIAAGLVAAVSLIVAGCEMCCNSSKGSGSMIITDPVTKEAHKATFSYRVECVGSYQDQSVNPNAVRKISGRLEYQDHGVWKTSKGKKLSVSIHGSVDNVLDTDVVWDPVVAQIAAAIQSGGSVDSIAMPSDKDDYCSKAKPNVAMFRGKYRPQPASAGEGGVFYITVEDKGAPGPSSEDTFEITLVGGVFHGYRQSGVLAGGNINAL